MRICMVCLCLGDVDKNPPIGGHESVVLQLCKVLHERGHEIIVITTPSLYTSNFKSEIMDLDWGKIFSLPISGSYGSLRYGLEFMFKALYKMKKLHNKEKMDIIHGHSGYPVLGLITGIAGKVLRIPSFHTIYSPVQTSGYRMLLNQFYLSLIDMLLSLSKNTENSLKRGGFPNKKNKIVRPVIDLSLFNPSIHREDIKRHLNIESENPILSPILLYVGDLTKMRGLHVLIEALSMVVRQFPSTKLLIAVNMPLEKYKKEKLEIKEKIDSYGLNDNIIPLGIVNNMPQVMAASNIFISPYLNIEGIADYPISMLEAMAVGKPVIATRVGGIPEIVKHKGYGMLVEPNNVDELVNTIIYMLNNKEEARKMGLEGAKLVSEKFRTEIVVDELERIYEGVISNYSSSRRC